jgi:hypothetical protein
MHAIISEGSESGGIERYQKYRDVLWYSVCRNTTLRNVARNAEVHLCELPATGGQLWPLLFLEVLSGAQHCASYADSVFTGRRGKSQRETFLWTKKMDLFSEIHFLILGAGNETRTRDPDLGKVVLYQLSYSRLVMRIL